MAVHDEDRGWAVQKSVAVAGRDPAFDDAGSRLRGDILIGHVRQRTVGEISVANTHPFRCGRWLFAHNGTIHDLEYVRTQVTPNRLSDVQGQTDSEVFFALLLTRLERYHAESGQPRILADSILARATEDVGSRPLLGSTNFLLSEGTVLYAHRCGRPLFMLHRDGFQHEAILVASEPITDEVWTELPERSLLCIWREPTLHWAFLSGGRR